MKERFLLYIDVLGFTDLVSQSNARIDDLYEVIASLHVHNHPSFKVIIFSDTILVYNVEGEDTRRDRTYLIMYLCESPRICSTVSLGKTSFSVLC